jgi:hypothetical protein
VAARKALEDAQLAAEAAAQEETIKVLVRPKGEAGNLKKGFVLQEAMDLMGTSDKDVLYKEIVVSLFV